MTEPICRSTWSTLLQRSTAGLICYGNPDGSTYGLRLIHKVKPKIEICTSNDAGQMLLVAQWRSEEA